MTSASALLGISLYETSDYARARPRLEAAVRANPNDNNARLFLVKDLTSLAMRTRPRPELQQLAKRQPENQEVWYMLARVYMKLSENAMAKINAIDANSILASSAFGRNDGSHEQLRWRRGGTEERLWTWRRKNLARITNWAKLTGVSRNGIPLPVNIKQN
jgi:predicted Zn-dependent protease